MSYPDYKQRLAKARQAMRAHDLEALLIFSPENLRYLTGFRGEAAYGVLTQRRMHLVTDYRFVQQAQEECRGTDIVCRDRDRQTLGEALRSILAGESVVSAGIETAHLSHATHASLASDLARFGMVPANGLVEGLRIDKDEWEIEQIAKAAAIADMALASLLAQFRLGVTERDMARELDYLVKCHGADDVAFPTILGFGANSARPHCVPSTRPLAKGDIVLIDFGAMVNGYRSDMTRTFVAGTPSALQARMMQAVLEAQEAAIAAVRPGAAGADVDARAARVLASTQFAHHAGPGTGHGVGLTLHEKPFLGPGCGDILRAGWVVTIEPALYVPGYGGVRYEDDVLVAAAGATCLTRSPKFPELAL